MMRKQTAQKRGGRAYRVELRRQNSGVLRYDYGTLETAVREVEVWIGLHVLNTARILHVAANGNETTIATRGPVSPSDIRECARCSRAVTPSRWQRHALTCDGY